MKDVRLFSSCVGYYGVFPSNLEIRFLFTLYIHFFTVTCRNLRKAAVSVVRSAVQRPIHVTIDPQ